MIEPRTDGVECAFFGSGARFHHIGMAVSSIRQASPASDPIIERAQKVSLAFLNLDGLKVELLEPLGDDSPIARSVREGVRVVHICFAVPNLEAAVAVGRRSGFHQISVATPSEVFGGCRIAWVYSPQFGLFELVEQESRAS